MKTFLLFLALLGTVAAQTVMSGTFVISGSVTPGSGGSGTPGGSDTQVQYNNAGAFAGAPGFTFDGTSKIGLGEAGTSVGGIQFFNATSGSITLQPVTGALGTIDLRMPALSGTLATLGNLPSVATFAEVNTGTDNAKIITPLALAGSGQPMDKSFALDTLVNPDLADPAWHAIITAAGRLTAQEILPGFTTDAAGVYAMNYLRPSPSRGGTAQVETATAAGTVTGAGNASVVVTAAAVTGSPITYNVPVLVGDTAATWAQKVRNFLMNSNPLVTVYSVSGTGTSIILTRVTPAANDATLNIALDNGTSTGITAAPTSANTTAGVVQTGNFASSSAMEFGFNWPTGATSINVTYDAQLPSGGSRAGSVRILDYPSFTTTFATDTPTYTTTLASFSGLTWSGGTPGTNYALYFALYNSTSLPIYVGNMKVTPVGASGVFDTSGGKHFLRIETRGNMQDTINRGQLGTSTSTANNAVQYQSEFSRLVLKTTATEMVVEVVSTHSSGSQFAEIPIWVNGAPYKKVQAPNNTITHNSVTLPAGEKLVEIFAGMQSSTAGYPPAGTFLKAVYVPQAGSTEIVRSTPGGNRILFYGDSILDGFATSGTVSGGLHAAPVVVRQKFNGSVTLDAWSGRALNDDVTASGGLDALVGYFRQANPNVIWIEIMANDKIRATTTPTVFGTNYALLLDKIHQAMPNVRVYCQTTTPQTSETSAVGGYYMSDFRWQVQQAALARPDFCTFVDGYTLVPGGAANIAGDGIHLTDAGNLAYGGAILNILQGFVVAPAVPPTMAVPITATLPTGSAVSLTTATPATVLTMTLTPGTWDIVSNIKFKPDTGTTVTLLQQGLSAQPAVFGAAGTYNVQSFPAGTVPGADTTVANPTVRVQVNAPTLYYVVVQSNFGVSTMGAYGDVTAYPVRVP